MAASRPTVASLPIPSPGGLVPKIRSNSLLRHGLTLSTVRRVSYRKGNPMSTTEGDKRYFGKRFQVTYIIPNSGGSAMLYGSHDNEAAALLEGQEIRRISPSVDVKVWDQLENRVCL